MIAKHQIGWVLDFQNTYAGSWETISAMLKDGNFIKWKIRVTKEGLFSIEGSDKDLLAFSRWELGQKFASYVEAVEFCTQEENLLHELYPCNSTRTN